MSQVTQLGNGRAKTNTKVFLVELIRAFSRQEGNLTYNSLSRKQTSGLDSWQGIKDITIISSISVLFSLGISPIWCSFSSPLPSLLWSPCALGKTDPPLFQEEGLRLKLKLICIIPPPGHSYWFKDRLVTIYGPMRSKERFAKSFRERFPEFNEKVSGKKCLPPDVRGMDTTSFLQLCRKPALEQRWQSGWQTGSLVTLLKY